MSLYENLKAQEKRINVKEFAKGYALGKIAEEGVNIYSCKPVEDFANAVYAKYLKDDCFSEELDKIITFSNFIMREKMFHFSFTEGFEDVGFYVLTNSIYSLQRKYCGFKDDKVKDELNKIYNEISENNEMEKNN